MVVAGNGWRGPTPTANDWQRAGRESSAQRVVVWPRLEHCVVSGKKACASRGLKSRRGRVFQRLGKPKKARKRHVLLKARSGSGHTNRGWFWKAGLIRQGQNQRLEEALGSNPERFAFFAVNRRLEGGGKNLGVVGCFHPLVRPHW